MFGGSAELVGAGLASAGAMAQVAYEVDVLTWHDRIAEALRYYPMQIAGSAIIGMTLGVLGAFVVLRRMALIGDALSHAILPGVVVAFLVMERFAAHSDGLIQVWGLFVGALVAGLVTAGAIGWVTRNARAKEDSAIGIVFTAMFGLGVILISLQPKGTHFDLTCFLFGLPLAIEWQDFLSILIVSPVALGFVVLAYRGLKMLSFDPQMASAVGLPVGFLHYALMALLAATVVAALRTVGVIMSVAMLITPAATAYQLTNRLSVRLVLSGLFGGLSATAGFLIAFVLNIPTGPAMVLVATLFFFVALLVGPEYGLIGRMLRRRAVRRHISEEDVLKVLAKAGRSRMVEEIAGEIPLSGARTRAAAGRLARQGLVATGGDGALALTAAGAERGARLVRSHRLWETYLASEKIAPEHLHAEAERLEHLHEIAETFAPEIGNPEIDPHGEPIPAKKG